MDPKYVGNTIEGLSKYAENVRGEINMTEIGIQELEIIQEGTIAQIERALVLKENLNEELRLIFQAKAVLVGLADKKKRYSNE